MVILRQIRQAIGELLPALSPLLFIQTWVLIKHVDFESSNLALYAGALHSFQCFSRSSAYGDL